MKVISGKYKGRILKGHDLEATRPTMDRVKESLFAMIQAEIAEKNILDLFAGSGNLGIEALSMHAKKVYFVDKNKKAIKYIQENLNTLDIEKEKYLLINKDYKDALSELKEKKIDIILLDPPYNTDYIEQAFLLINKYNMINKNGLIICETDKLIKIPTKEDLKEIKNKKYGDKYIVIFRKI